MCELGSPWVRRCTRLLYPWFQTSAAMLRRGITRRRAIIVYRRFGTTYRSHLDGRGVGGIISAQYVVWLCICHRMFWIFWRLHKKNKKGCTCQSESSRSHWDGTELGRSAERPGWRRRPAFCCTSWTNDFPRAVSSMAPMSSTFSSALFFCLLSCLKYSLLLKTFVTFLKIVFVFGTWSSGNFHLNLPHFCNIGI
jgi:hypothetical protein